MPYPYTSNPQRAYVTKALPVVALDGTNIADVAPGAGARVALTIGLTGFGTFGTSDVVMVFSGSIDAPLWAVALTKGSPCFTVTKAQIGDGITQPIKAHTLTGFTANLFVSEVHELQGG